MGEEIKILYLYNSALLISYGGEAILIDGVFEERNIFDKMPNGYEESLLNRQTPFNNVIALMFTHCHPDHYNDRVVEEFRRKFPDIPTISPIKVNGECIHSPSGKFVIGPFEISYFDTEHIYVGPEKCPHYVYKVCVDKKEIVVSGDMNPDKLEEIINRYGIDADAFFINPALLMYEMKNPETTSLKEITNLYIYHIPSEMNDDYGYRKAILSLNKKINTHLGNAVVLMDNMQTMSF